MSRCVKAPCPLCDCCTSFPHGGGLPETPHGSILPRAGPLMLARLGVAAFTFPIPMVLARVLLPESYGAFKQAWLLSNTLFLVLPLGPNQALVSFVPREPQKKVAWESHALLLTTGLGALAAALLLVFGPLVSALFHNPELAAVMPSVAAFTALRLAGSSFALALMADGRIKASAVVRVASEGFYTLCLLIGALWTRSVAGAFAGVVVATFAKAAACWIVLAGPGLRIAPRDLRRQLAYALPFGAAFALVIPQQQFHSYLVSATVTAAAFAVYSVGCFQLPIVDMLYTPVSEVLQLRISVLKLLLTVPLVWAGLRLFGPIGALGGWICAEETCRMILLHRAATLFGTRLTGVIPREVWLQIAAAAIATAPGALALQVSG